MENTFALMHDGYNETIRKGLAGVRNLTRFTGSDDTYDDSIRKLKNAVENADTVVVGAGAGLSTSAGFTYSGERFEKYFYDFAAKYGIRDMYSGGFYPFPDSETLWAWWARHIYYNRYINASKPVYQNLLTLLRNKDYFVITTNVDHQFQRAGFDKKRLFYTQGDYGLFQSTDSSIQKTYDNEEWVIKAMEAQGFEKEESGMFVPPKDKRLLMKLPSALIPKCPDDGGNVVMNLRSDDSFAEDEGWHKASAAYADFLNRHEKDHVLYLEIGVGSNTPVIIKYPFWQMTLENSKAVYACLNYDEAFCPVGIKERSICIEGDAGDIIKNLL